MAMEQVFLAWSLMAVQGLRRLCESITLVKPSSAKMWFVHWFVGIAFYLAVGVAVWIEGVGTCYQETFAFNYGVTLEEIAQIATSMVHQARLRKLRGNAKRLPDSLQVLGADFVHCRNYRISNADTR